MPKINYTEEDLEDHNGMGAVIKDDKGQILVQEHVKYGFWTLPVGKAKKDSDVKEGLKKELLEECGINAVKFREIAKRDYYYTRNKRKYYRRELCWCAKINDESLWSRHFSRALENNKHR